MLLFPENAKKWISENGSFGLFFSMTFQRISDFLIEGCFVNVLGLGYHDVTSPRGDGSCPAMTGLCSRVDGGNGVDTVKAMITI